MISERLLQLLARQLGHTASDDEISELQNLLQQYPEHNFLVEILGSIEGEKSHREPALGEDLLVQESWLMLKQEMDENKTDKIFDDISPVANEKEIPHIHFIRKYHLKWWAAAAILIVLAGSAYLFSRSMGTGDNIKVIAQSKPIMNDLAPGHEGAILTLANGETIILDSAHNGLLANQGNTNILKENGKVRYQDRDNAGSEIMYNTMTTPKGRQYQLILSDGSKVWLNAASSITYPTAFNGKERRVSVTGEVYFEIKHLSFNSVTGEEAVPFFVDYNSSPNKSGEIKVMGTHFNVMDYDDERTVKTTLLEGSVKVTENNKTVTIKPGEQAVLNKDKNTVSVVDADVDEAVAWKNGFFNFKSATIETIMRQVERWYDVEVVYNGVKPMGHYRGEVPMNVNASEMLKVLEVSGIHFKIDGKKIIVM
ncbi:MAG: FecR domain-containing protein [Ginsengibacter sp.]